MRRLIAVAALGAGLGLGIGGGVPLDGFAPVAEGLAGVVAGSSQDPAPAPSSAIPSAREFVILDDCMTKEGASVAQGRATNPTADDLAFEIDIFFATDAGTVVGRSRAEVSVAAGETEPWTVSADTQTGDAQCVIGTVHTDKTDATGSSTVSLTGWRLLAAVALAVIAVVASALAWVRYRKVRGAAQLAGAPAYGPEESVVLTPDAQGASARDELAASVATVGPRHAKERAKVAEPADGLVGQEPQPASSDVVEASEQQEMQPEPWLEVPEQEAQPEPWLEVPEQEMQPEPWLEVPEQEAQPEPWLEVPEWPGPDVEVERASAAETEPAGHERPAAPKSRRRKVWGSRSDAATGEQAGTTSADEAPTSAEAAPVSDVATSAEAPIGEVATSTDVAPVDEAATTQPDDDLVVSEEDATPSTAPAGAEDARAARRWPIRRRAHRAAADAAAADEAKTGVAKTDVAKTDVEPPVGATAAVAAADVAADAGPDGDALIGLLSGPADGSTTSADAAMASKSTDETATDWLADLGLDLDLDDMLGLDDILGEPGEPAQPGAGDAKATPRNSQAGQGAVTDRAAAPANDDDTDWLAGLFEEDV